MASGARWRADVARGCDAALRPRGRATGGPRGAQEAHSARTRGRRPHVSTRVHVGTPVGRHVAGEVGIWRAHGLVGPGKILGAVIRKRYTAPQFKLGFLHLFLRVGLCPTRFLPVQDAWRLSGRWIPSERRRSRGPEFTRSSNQHVRLNDE